MRSHRKKYKFKLAKSMNQINNSKKFVKKCVHPNLVNFGSCRIPPPMNKNDLNSKNHCEPTLKFIECMSRIFKDVCVDETPRVVAFIQQIKKEIALYNSTYEKNCNRNYISITLILILY